MNTTVQSLKYTHDRKIADYFPPNDSTMKIRTTAKGRMKELLGTGCVQGSESLRSPHREPERLNSGHWLMLQKLQHLQSPGNENLWNTNLRSHLGLRETEIETPVYVFMLSFKCLIYHVWSSFQETWRGGVVALSTKKFAWRKKTNIRSRETDN